MRRRQDQKSSEATELAALADGSLAPDRRAPLEERVAASRELADRLEEQERAVALARSAAEAVEAPVALRARIEARERARRDWMPRGIVLAGAAATAVLALAIGLAVIRSGPTGERLEAALGPTELAPGAKGEATLTKTPSGWRIELNVTGLPRLESGRFYEVWLRNAVGGLVPIGTFNDGRSVTLWAGVSPREYTTLSVTRERDDGDQASSGKKVLVGTVDVGGSG